MIHAALAAFAMYLSPPPSAPPPQDYLQWQQKRDTSLRAEKGWLSLVGLHWLDVGTHKIGRGKGNAVQLAGGPKQLGTITLAKDGALSLSLSSTKNVLVDGKPATDKTVLLHTDKSGAPTEIASGSFSFFPIDRSGRIGLRAKDANSPTRTHFLGLRYFDYNPAWVVTAKYQAYATPRSIEVATIIGTVEPTPNPGFASFEVAGQQFNLQLLEGNNPGEYFTIIGDRTNGKSTYGMARFLAGKLEEGAKTVVLDFNRMYNPPCAFTPFATCPMPPEGNRMNIEVPAGEQKYAGGKH
jgi:uncharacterized protein